MRLTYRRTATLTREDRASIWALMRRSVCRDRAAFEDKLAKTDEVFLGVVPEEGLVAFGAVDTIEQEIEGQTHALLYTHWAVIDPRYRGRNIIQRVGFRYFLRYRARHPLRPVYWMLTASTFHSYLLLVRNFRTFWPKEGTPWPRTQLALVASVMERDAGDAWDAEAGVLRRHGSSRYLEGVVDDVPAMLDHPEHGPSIRFYHDRNPGQIEGDSLVCLCPLGVDNCWSWALTALRRWRRRATGARRPEARAAREPTEEWAASRAQD